MARKENEYEETDLKKKEKKRTIETDCLDGAPLGPRSQSPQCETTWDSQSGCFHQEIP